MTNLRTVSSVTLCALAAAVLFAALFFAPAGNSQSGVPVATLLSPTQQAPVQTNLVSDIPGLRLYPLGVTGGKGTLLAQSGFSDVCLCPFVSVRATPPSRYLPHDVKSHEHVAGRVGIRLSQVDCPRGDSL